MKRFFFFSLILFLHAGMYGQNKLPYFQGYALKSFFMDASVGKLHYQKVGNPQNPTLILIHGSPGDVSAWEKLLEDSVLLHHFYVILFDRAPYGKTTLSGGSLSHQSEQLSDFITQHCQPCGLLSHSYGAALALQLGVDYPDQVKAIISLAGTIAAPYQKARWYNYIAKYSPLRWLLSKDFKASNKEMWQLSDDLAMLEKKWPNLNVPVLLYQGGKDVLVEARSAAYTDALLPESQLVFRPKKNHFVIWTDIPDVVQVILDWKENISW